MNVRKWWNEVLRLLVALLAVAAWGTLVLLFGGCASVQRTAGLVVGGLPRVSVSGTENIGIALGGQNIAIDNGTNYYGRVVVLGKDLTASAPFGPGDEIIATKYFEPFNSVQIPIVVTFYRDPGHTQCVGGVGRIFGFSIGQPGSIPWPIVAREIQLLEGVNSQEILGINTPLPATAQVATGVKMPREFIQGTVSIQVTNLSLFDLTVGVIGTNRVVVPPCGTYYKSRTEFLGQPKSVTVELTFTQPGAVPGQPFLHGKTSFICPVPPEGVLACLILASPQMIRR